MNNQAKTTPPQASRRPRQVRGVQPESLGIIPDTPAELLALADAPEDNTVEEFMMTRTEADALADLLAGRPLTPEQHRCIQAIQSMLEDS